MQNFMKLPWPLKLKATEKVTEKHFSSSVFVAVLQDLIHLSDPLHNVLRSTSHLSLSCQLFLCCAQARRWWSEQCELYGQMAGRGVCWGEVGILCLHVSPCSSPSEWTDRCLGQGAGSCWGWSPHCPASSAVFLRSCCVKMIKSDCHNMD